MLYLVTCYALCHWIGDVTVAGRVIFSLNSDQHGESPQFTLTCNSFNGSATTTVWTRDGQEVSGGQTMLDDPELAQYTHTLTVNSRLGGVYKCTVSNNKPSAASANYTVKSEPLNQSSRIKC